MKPTPTIMILIFYYRPKIGATSTFNCTAASVVQLGVSTEVRLLVAVSVNQAIDVEVALIV